MEEPLSSEEKTFLLKLARQAIEEAVNKRPLGRLDLKALPKKLKQPGASFITLTIAGELRGCIGALEPHLPLAEDVREHAVAAALQDYRFPPVQPDELPRIEIEVSRLSPPQPLEYHDADDLLNKLRPGVDGVILVDGIHRATFLPQVWDKLPGAPDFLDHLCYKMGAPPNLWRQKKLKILTYQVEEFHE
jgi:AmmeMemoRadiSam system protein A